jgi:undecaprenyl-diphosphatase
MILFKSLIMGIVEGLTEFIPVSSTGHLILTQNAMNFTGHVENVFSIFIQLGAILAVVWLYRKKFLEVTLTLPNKPESRRLVINLVIGTLPAVVIGLPTEAWIEAHFFKPFPVALALIAGGFLILLIEKKCKGQGISSVDDISYSKAVSVGTVQVLAILFPGISRSGATIMGGMALGLSRTAATEFSFFLAIPAMLGASMVKIYKARDILSVSDVPMFAVGFVVSFLVALLVIRWLIGFVSRKSFNPFAWYRIGFGVVVLAYGFFRGSF